MSRYERHRHRDPVSLPDGTVIWAVSFDAEAPYERDEVPEFGLYLDTRWDPPWPHEHLDWPDFSIPGNRAELRVCVCPKTLQVMPGVSGSCRWITSKASCCNILFILK
jgi:hypothetical protein